MSRTPPALLLPGLALNVLIASGTFLVAKRTVAEFPPLQLAMFRFMLAALVMWPIVRVLEPRVRIEPRDRPRIWLLGLLAVALNQGLFLYGLKWASASHAALLYALTPAMAYLIGWIGGGTRPTGRQAAGTVLAFAGVLMLMLQAGLHFESASLIGDLIIFAAVIAWALYLVAARAPIQRYGPLRVTAEALVAGAVLYLPVGVIASFSFAPSSISPMGWGGLLYLALLTSALNYVLWCWGLKYLSAGTVAMITNLQPVVTVLMAWAFLNEPVPARFAISAALVLGGVWLVIGTRRSMLRRALPP